MAPPRLLPETERMEAVYADQIERLRSLKYQQAREERDAQRALEAELATIDAQFETERAGFAQLEPSIRQSIEQALREKGELAAAAVRRTYQDRAKECAKSFEEQRMRWESELFLTLDSLVRTRRSRLSDAVSEPESEPAPKRKANRDPSTDSPAPQNRNKRAKFDKPARKEKATAPSSPEPSLPTPDRTISFEEVFGHNSQPPKHRHIIVHFPANSGRFYILRCDEHGVHFGEHPLRGAAKHLASAQHGFMSKAHVTAISTLGHRVRDCTQEMADMNNAVFLRYFKAGAYKVFNANTLSQTKRAELGYPPLDPPNWQRAAAAQKKSLKEFAGIVNPVPCRFYVASGEPKCPVLVLPWGDMAPTGLRGTLADTGIFREVSEDGKQLAVPKLPKCYVYEEVDGRVRGIKGWAAGYEDGGPMERRREFPVLCAENADFRYWAVGWVTAAHLLPLDFNDESSRSIPFFREIRQYYVQRILRRDIRKSTDLCSLNSANLIIIGKGEEVSHNRPRPVAKVESEDVEMEDAPAENSTSKGDKSRLSNVSDEEDSRAQPTSAPPSPESSAAQMIAAQALNLQTPARSAFKPINATNRASTSTSRGPSPTRDPPSRAGSVSSTGGGNHRRVLKIHARSSRPSQTPSIVLPNGPPTAPRPVPQILQPPNAGLGSSRISSQSPKPVGAPMRAASYSKTMLSAASAAEREDRAGSAPVQIVVKKSPAVEDVQSLESRNGTPQPADSAASPAAAVVTALSPSAVSDAAAAPATTAAPQTASPPALAPEPIKPPPTTPALS
ncbi:hypothetical protein N0V88_001464 [Collariella sp. IMI 366227]|nr:hypothetical protein N0V88_001464 [Collariella sp. IMI 366227]